MVYPPIEFSTKVCPVDGPIPTVSGVDVDPYGDASIHWSTVLCPCLLAAHRRTDDPTDLQQKRHKKGSRKSLGRVEQ